MKRIVGATGFLCWAAAAWAAEEAAAPAGQEIQVGLYLLSLGKMDMGTGAFTADFYLTMKSDKPVPETFEFQNGRAASQDKTDDKPTEKVWRIQANLVSPVDLQRYPFDTQRIQIILEDKQKALPALRYAVSKEGNGLDKGIWFPGWDIVSSAPEIGQHEYPAFNETYSTFTLNVDIRRVRLSAFIKTFLPVIFIMLVVLSSFILDLEKVATRLAMVSSGLVASVMFHVSISSQVPPVGYLTFADKFMVMTYFILLAGFFLNAWMMVLQGKKRDEVALKWHHATRTSVFISVPLLYLALFLFFL